MALLSTQFCCFFFLCIYTKLHGFVWSETLILIGVVKMVFISVFFKLMVFILLFWIFIHVDTLPVFSLVVYCTDSLF